jgi:hypothetical protein
MSSHTSDPHHYDEPSSSTIYGDLDVGDATQVASEEHAILIDEDEHYSTGYSEFCDDDTIVAAPDTIPNDYSSPTVSSPATTLGKRKSPEDSGLSDTVHATYKRQASTGSDGAESSSEPYIIVSLNQNSLSAPKKLPFRQ